jgi:hypothetical protein
MTCFDWHGLLLTAIMCYATLVCLVLLLLIGMTARGVDVLQLLISGVDTQSAADTLIVPSSATYTVGFALLGSSPGFQEMAFAGLKALP